MHSAGDNLLNPRQLQIQIEARDREIANPYTKDNQVMNIHMRAAISATA